MFDWLANSEILKPAYTLEWISGLIGAGGAVLGSLVTILWTEWFNSRSRKRERREKFSAGSFAAYQRLNKIYSLSVIIRNHLESGIAAAKAERGAPICAKIQPINRLSGPIYFTIEELWTIAQLGGSDLINNINSLDDSFNALLDLMERYERERADILAQVIPERMEGLVGTLGLTEEQMKRLRPKFAALDAMAVDTAKMATSIVTDCFEALVSLVKVKSRPLGKEFEILLPDPKGRPVKINASGVHPA